MIGRKVEVEEVLDNASVAVVGRASVESLVAEDEKPGCTQDDVHLEAEAVREHEQPRRPRRFPQRRRDRRQ